MKFITVPNTYADDAQSRDLDIGEEVKRTKRYTTFECTEAQLAEMRSDAEYYSTEWKHMGPEYRGLGQSAKSTVKRIDDLAAFFSVAK